MWTYVRDAMKVLRLLALDGPENRVLRLDFTQSLVLMKKWPKEAAGVKTMPHDPTRTHRSVHLQ